MALTDCLLLRVNADLGSRDGPSWATWLAAGSPPTGRGLLPAPKQVRVACTAADENGQALTHVYVHFDPATPISAEQAQGWASGLSPWAGLEAQACRLQRVLDCECASAHASIHAHYTVQTDPEDGWDEEIAQWYAQEHMPGLARVPGCISAQRYINIDHGPRSFACYDLTAAEVMGSPEWLAVRATDWSSRCRPHFTHTRRTFFQTLHTLDGAHP